jgi:RND family efflux transporter MFP subunit
VLVRPGARVRRGDVLATLDCRESSAQNREIAARARALSERQRAVEHEAERLKDLTTGGFASANEAEQIAARSKSEASEVQALRASLASRSLQVNDCVLRAPFAGEVAERFIDPGAYVRPGTAIVTVIDRGTVRVSADAPESDFAVVAPGTQVGIEVIASGAKLRGRISRRAPAADEQTRTIHFEIDLGNADRALPVGTTATIAIDVGQPQPATSIPLRAATVRGDRATLFIVESGVAKRAIVPVLGEARGTLFVDPKLGERTHVVVEGRALLDDNDRVAERELEP